MRGYHLGRLVREEVALERPQLTLEEGGLVIRLGWANYNPPPYGSPRRAGTIIPPGPGLKESREATHITGALDALSCLTALLPV